MNLTKLFALFGATILLSNYLPAQDDVDIEDADEVEEVVVTGIKRSLLDAIDIKRSNTGIVDAITTEDFGKFADNLYFFLKICIYLCRPCNKGV